MSAGLDVMTDDMTNYGHVCDRARTAIAVCSGLLMYKKKTSGDVVCSFTECNRQLHVHPEGVAREPQAVAGGREVMAGGNLSSSVSVKGVQEGGLPALQAWLPWHLQPKEPQRV